MNNSPLVCDCCGKNAKQLQYMNHHPVIRVSATETRTQMWCDECTGCGEDEFVACPDEFVNEEGVCCYCGPQS